MSTPTATPRTDAAWAASFSPDRANFSVRDECEKLETELETEKTNRNHLIEKGAKLETELAAVKAECYLNRTRIASLFWSGVLDKYTGNDVQKLAADYTAELTAERERVRVLREALEQVGELVEQMLCVPISEESVVSAKAYGIIDAALAATKEGSK